MIYLAQERSPAMEQPYVLFPKAAFDIIAVAASAGGLRTIRSVLSPFPCDFPAAIMIVQHLDPHRHSMLPSILARSTQLKVTEAGNGDTLTPGHVYVAPPDWHLTIRPDGKVALTQTELVRFLRPSADLLFESVAAFSKTRAIAVVLSGTGSDGTRGIKKIKEMGGMVLVQDLASAEFNGMPHSAIDTGLADYILPLDNISSTILSLVTRGAVA
jgi:two-component system chemotaxis response regulator CheB